MAISCARWPKPSTSIILIQLDTIFTTTLLPGVKPAGAATNTLRICGNLNAPSMHCVSKNLTSFGASKVDHSSTVTWF